MAVGFVTNPNHYQHFMTGHPESPDRLESALVLLRECGLRERLHEIEPRVATDEELGWVHPPEFLAELRRFCEQAPAMIDLDTYVQPQSYDIAVTAAGSTVAATDAVLRGEVDSAFCALRPPGHHASPSNAMGFCLLNNIAVAAEAARRGGLRRLLCPLESAPEAALAGVEAGPVARAGIARQVELVHVHPWAGIRGHGDEGNTGLRG